MSKIKNNITITKLKKITLKKGNVLKFIDKKDKNFFGFGEVYFSLIKKNKIKAWKKHTKMIMNLTVPIGRVKFVFFNEDRKFLKEVIVGDKDYKRITVKPGIWFGFKGLSNGVNLVSNFSNIVHESKESTNIEISEIIYKW